jgi:ABC-2 type transport system ATP-binding protein
MTTTVRLAGVTKRYRGTTALDGIDLTFRPGITGLLGPNGAGKTTLLRIIATVLAPDEGGVHLLGRSPETPETLADVRRRLGYLPQEMGFPRGFTGFAFVDYMAVLKEWTERSARHDEVRRVLGLVDLADVATKRVRALSGGQRRRVALAQALLGDPELLLLDEPTTGVDPQQRVSLRRVLSQAGERSTVLLSTHQTEDVAALCDRVVVLDQGRARFDGAVTDLVGTAAGRVWLADAPDPTAQASWRTGTGKHRHVGDAAPPGAEPAEPTLEDAYLLLVGDRARTTGVPA